MTENVILVSRSGQAVGTCEKWQAHKDGKLHRAFSLMIARPVSGGFELLLQQRARHKYHSGSKWSNTCCSHPRPGETLSNAVRRRVDEELGIKCPLDLIELSSVIYCAELDNGLTENEFDHVFLGILDTFEFHPNPEEVSAVKWASIEAIKRDLLIRPDMLTVWFPSVFEVVCDHLESMDGLGNKMAS